MVGGSPLFLAFEVLAGMVGGLWVGWVARPLFLAFGVLVKALSFWWVGIDPESSSG